MIKISITNTDSADHHADFNEFNQDDDRARWRGAATTDKLPRESRPAHRETEIVGPECFIKGSND